MRSRGTIYEGCRNSTGCRVWVNHRPLLPHRSFRLARHALAFGWGYAGQEPAQLALAILLDFTESRLVAPALYQRFKLDHVAKWLGPRWQLPGFVILDWMGQPLQRQALALVDELKEPVPYGR